MDERHWWIATKIQETFRVNDIDSPTVLEPFFLEANNFDLITQFLSAHGIDKLFVYGNRPEDKKWKVEDLIMTSNLMNLKDVTLDSFVCVYMMRPSIEHNIDQLHMHKDIFCSEIKNNPLRHLSSILSQIILPMVKAKQLTSKRHDDVTMQQLNQSIEKHVTALVNATNDSKTANKQILRIPKDFDEISDYIPHRMNNSQIDPNLIGSYEEILSEWIHAIESVLLEGIDEKLLDVNSGPLTEIDRWKRRQRKLIGINEQLKSKECKNVVGVLIQAKSRVIRQWRNVDTSITDAMNEAKDKVKYLDNLKKYLEQLNQESNPLIVVNNILPGLMSTIKQTDSSSRFYARTGYLGIICKKIGNRLGSLCRDFVGDLLKEPVDMWKVILTELEENEPKAPSFKVTKKGVKKKELICEDPHLLTSRLRLCVFLENFFIDMLRSLQEIFGQSGGGNAPNFNQSITSLDAISSRRMKKMKSANQTSSILSESDGSGDGIHLNEIEMITSNIELTCGKMKQLLQIISSLRQFHRLAKETIGLPRVQQQHEKNRKDEDDDSTETSSSIDSADSASVESDEPEAETQQNWKNNKIQYGMVTVPEEDENQSANKSTSVMSTERDIDTMNDGESWSGNHHHGTSTNHEQNECLKNLFSHHDDDPSISNLISHNNQVVVDSMRHRVTSSLVLDLQHNSKEKFEESFVYFNKLCGEFEEHIGNYLQAVFSRHIKTKNSLTILSKFDVVTSRPSLRDVFVDHYSTAYSQYLTELQNVQELYESNKNDPILARDAPPAAGAIFWSRRLLEHIEQPMKTFHEKKLLTHHKDHQRIVKLYNKLATALVTYETLWYQQWTKSISGSLGGLKLPVLRYEEGLFLLNLDPQIPRLLQEARWFRRLNLEIPDSVMNIVKKEKQFKYYRNHLQQCLQEYYQVVASIPQPLIGHFKLHVTTVTGILQSGLTTVTWENMNIDGYLHRIRSTTQRLQNIVKKIQHIVDVRIDENLKKIENFLLFSEDDILGKSWKLNEFAEKMKNSIDEKSGYLSEYVGNIEKAINDIVTILSSSRINSAEHHYKASTSTDKTLNRLTKSSPSKRNPLKRNTTSVSTHLNNEHQITIESEISQKLLAYYCNLTYNAVLKSILQSYQLFSTAIGARDENYNNLNFLVEMKFNIPRIELQPNLNETQETINQVSQQIIAFTKELSWWSGPSKNESFHSDILSNEEIAKQIENFSNVTKGLESDIDDYIHDLSQFNFLWEEDMQRSHAKFTSPDPGMEKTREKVEYLLGVERKVKAIEEFRECGVITLCSNPIKDALRGIADAWKTQYAMVLHEDAKRRLDSVVQYRNDLLNRLIAPVTTLEQLNSTLNLLDEVHDMENKIDGIYLPIENVYEKLKTYDLRLARSELQQVEGLRLRWLELVKLADSLGQSLVKERRSSFEQELDKQLKTFVVEVIQYRNSFDAQGPAVAGIRPPEAVTRLQDFKNRFAVYDAKRKTLDAVQRLFGISPKPFSELEKTGEELQLLGMLYGLFQKFITFDRKLRDTLWENVELKDYNNEVKGYWQECLDLPDKLKEWEAYNEMKDSINFYLDVFPILHTLAKKGKFKDLMIAKIRNRHWLEVMSVTNSKFQLEANLFKLGHLLDTGLLKHEKAIKEIASAASKELELEIKMRTIEEEWTEQVLTFDNYKRRGPVLLAKDDSERLLEQLEDAQALLANMLTSKHIGPLRDEAASWAEKLKGVTEVLDMWLDTQNLWLDLESVFSNPVTAKELPQEAKRFHLVDKSYVKLVRTAYETKNVLQCCYGGEVPKGVVLKHMQEELSICFKCLTQYLDEKRSIYPRFYFLTDAALLALISRPFDIEYMRPHLRSLFSSLSDLRIEHGGSTLTGTPSSVKSSFNTSLHHSDYHHSIDDSLTKSTLSKIKSGLKSAETAAYSGGSVNGDVTETYHVVGVVAEDKEILSLDDEVYIRDGIESWLSNLQSSVSNTVHSKLCQGLADVKAGVPLEEIAVRYPGQISRICILYIWTRDCESAINELKIDRKALQTEAKKFASSIARLPIMLNRASRNIDDSFLTIYKLRIENLISYSIHLRDSIDSLTNKKIRDISDFEWRRNIRFYPSPSEDASMNQKITIFEHKMSYGYEYQGTSSNIVITPTTEKAFLVMCNAIRDNKGCALVGENGRGKTETVRGLSGLLGKFLFMLNCSDSLHHNPLSQILQGLATEGCWGCFDDFHRLSPANIGIILDFTASIISAVKQKLTHTSVLSIHNDESPIKINNQIALFLTSSSSAPKQLSSDIKVMYRTMWLAKPDVNMILRAKCASAGLRSHKLLADRLRTMMDLSHRQIIRNNTAYHEVNLSSIFAAIKLASYKRKSKDDRSDTRTDSSRTEKQTTRSSSQAQIKPLTSQSSSMLRSSTVDKSGMKKSCPSPSPLTSQAKVDHGYVAQALLETICPSFSTLEQTVFFNIIHDIFHGVTWVLPSLNIGTSSALSTYSANSVKNHDLETAICQVTNERGLTSHGNFIAKVVQLHQVAKLRQGVIIAGSPGSGKSTILSILLDALCLLPQRHRSNSGIHTNAHHKLLTINPLTVDDVSTMFGSVTSSNEWNDGLLTYAWRKANRNQSVTWLCFDGALVSSWTEHLNSALDNKKIMTLSNGENLHLTNNMRLIFETVDLTQASPSLITRSGMVYVDNDVIGWRPIAQAWLQNRSSEERTVLEKSFDKMIDPVCSFLFNEMRMKIPVCEVGLFKTCLTLLNEMLKEHQQNIGGDLHIERIFLFCLIWSFGGLLEGKESAAFSELLKTLSTGLPDYDHEVSVFDYYVDDSGEWDGWLARVPEATYVTTTDVMGEVFVDTVKTVKTRYLIELFHLAKQHTLLLGERGVGKTSLINDIIDTQDKQGSVICKLVFSKASSASQLNDYIQHNIEHRQGFVYGARGGRTLECFIDDVNLPAIDHTGVQRSNELLRTLMDNRSIYKLDKPFEWRTVEGLQVTATMTTDESRDFDLDARLLRHFATVRLDAPSSEDLFNVIYSVMEVNFGDRSISSDLHESIAEASCKIYKLVKDVLKPCQMPGREFYYFSLRQITRVCQCMRLLSDEDRDNDHQIISLWKHEMERVMRDQLSRVSDTSWFDENVDKIITESFTTWLQDDDTIADFNKYFVTFPVETKVNHRPVSSSSNSIKVHLQTISDPNDTLQCLKAHLNHFNDDQQQRHKTLDDVIFSEDVLNHVIRLHRVMSYRHSGNIVAVGQVGSHLTQLMKLALHLANLRPFPIDTSRTTAFFDSLRTVVRMAGIEGRPVAILLSARELNNPTFLDAINSLLISGEYPHLFSNDEIDGLLQVLTPILKRNFPNVTNDPMKYFISRIKCNLRIIITIPPHHQLLKDSLNAYPGIVSESQVIWLRDWPQNVLIQQAEFFINHNQVAHDILHKTRESLTMAIANIHSLTLREFNQAVWAGEVAPTITIEEVSLELKKEKETIRCETLDVPNLPYSKQILLERIKLLNRDEKMKSSVELFTGPFTYRRFMQCLHTLYNKHSRMLDVETLRLRQALDTLEETRADVDAMEDAIQLLNEEFSDAQVKVTDLFQKLTNEATRLEKVKAQFGIGGESLHAFLQLKQEDDDDFEEEDSLLLTESDEYDIRFEQMKEAHLNSKRVKIDEEMQVARLQVDDARLSLTLAKTQVEHWRSKVDRGCIERLKAFKKPPLLVAQVLEMVMILVEARPWLTTSREEGEKRREDGGRLSRVSSTSTWIGGPKRPSGVAGTLRRRASSKNIAKKIDVDIVKWKSMQNFMNDTVRFVDMIHGVSWQSGLGSELLDEVESYLVKGKDGEEGVTGEGSMLKEQANHVAQRKSSGKGITIAAARYSSEDAAVLVEYVISIVEYTKRCAPLQHAIREMDRLEIELEKMQQVEAENRKMSADAAAALRKSPEQRDTPERMTSIVGLTEDDIPTIQASVDNLQSQYDVAVIKKYKLKNELQTSKEKLRSALSTLENLRPLERQWTGEYTESITKEELVTNCTLAAAYLTYCGGMTLDARSRMLSFYTHVCRHYELPTPNKMLFTNYSLSDFLRTSTEIQQLKTKDLPNDSFSLDQSCLLTYDDVSWSLICDAQGLVIDWLNQYHNNKINIINYENLRSQFETNLSEGNTLLVTYCDVKKLVDDVRFHEVLRCANRFRGKQTTFKIMVGDHEVECNPNFKLYLHTAVTPQYIPSELSAYTTVVYIQTPRDSVEHRLLDRFVKVEKLKLYEEWKVVQQEKLNNMEKLKILETQLKNNLNGEYRLLNNLNLTKKLAEIKKEFDETWENQNKILVNETSIVRAKNGFREVAAKAAVLFQVTRSLSVINPIYSHHWREFQRLYDASVQYSERSPLKTIANEMTYSIFSHLRESLAEDDRPLLALMLAIEVEDLHGNVRIGEREFLISPEYGQSVMQAAGIIPSESRSKVAKPFEWMSDDQFRNIQILASYYDWFQDLFDKITRDGREVQWRSLCEGDFPENPNKCKLPDNADKYYTPLQRLLVIRALRSDRLLHASNEFIIRTLGRKYVKEDVVNLCSAYQLSDPIHPIILLSNHAEQEKALEIFNKFSKKMNVIPVVIQLTGCADETGRVRKVVGKSIESGAWVMLHNAHTNTSCVESIMYDVTTSNNQSADFRLWMTAEADIRGIPQIVLHTSIKIIIDHPRFMKSNLVRFAITSLGCDVINMTSRVEWLPALHNICLLHGALLLRSRFPNAVGWKKRKDFMDINITHLKEAIEIITREFKEMDETDSKSILWSSIRYQLCETIYGRYVLNNHDILGLNAIIDYWMCANSVKKDFELSRTKYRLPSSLFTANVKQSSLVQSFDAIPNYLLEIPEACNLHPSFESVLGNEQYLFTRLNAIYDSLPQSTSLSHKLFPRPPTPNKHERLTTIAPSSAHPLIVDRGFFSTHSVSTLKMKKPIYLWEICHQILPKLPKAWTKDYVSERLRRFGANKQFNQLIEGEIAQLSTLLNEIKRCLTSLKYAVETLDRYGDQLSANDVISACELLNGKIPMKWMRLGGETCPPQHTSVHVWVADLLPRWQHFERILSLGKDKLPAYWLGAFFNPHSLLSLLKQEAIRNHMEKSGTIENIIFQTEITQRDKDHLRDPPSEGFFIHGVYIWGSSWDKTSGELVDLPSKTGPISLPIIHITFSTDAVKSGNDSSRSGGESFPCPVFVTSECRSSAVFELETSRDSVPTSRWSLRGLKATIRPY